MTVIDYLIVFGYLVTMLAIGVLHLKDASDSVQSYFLGGHRIPWWVTAMSSSMSSIDITGTMINVSILYFMGVRSFYYNIWMVGGVALMCHLGRWIRRSNVVTAAEWMSFRFGEGWTGELPRLTIALVSIGSLIGYIAYAYVGVGKFISAFAPALSSDPTLNSQLWGILVISFTALYAMLGGLFSVAYTDLIQTFILFLTSIYISVLAFIKVSPDFIASHTPSGWETLRPTARIDYMSGVSMAGYPEGAFAVFWPWVMMWGFQTLLSFFSGPGMGPGTQFMLSTKSARDTCKQGAGYELLTFPKWTLVVGITLLALSVGNIDLQDTDMVLPQMINSLLPWGVKGFVLVGFLAAFMSTFSISINNGTSYVIRDIYIRHLRPGAGQREFIYVTYVSSLVFVILGVLLGLRMHSVLVLGVWVFSILAGSMVVPLVLRWYWWRFNGWGFAFGMISAFLVAVAQKVIQTNFGYIWPDYAFYTLMIAVSLAVSLVVTLATPATNRATLEEFYHRTQPWGFWKPVHAAVIATRPGFRKERMLRLDLLNCVVGAACLFCLNMMPVYLMLHNWSMFWKLALVFTVTAATMYRTWYRTLPRD
jgi:solute:Na+ symporter, SSS family